MNCLIAFWLLFSSINLIILPPWLHPLVFIWLFSLLSNTLPPSVSQDGLHGLLTNGIGMNETLAMSLNSASPHVTAARANTLGRTDTVSPVGLGNVNSLAAAVAAAAAAANATASAAGSPAPPLPPPNHPGYDMVDTRTVESPYGGTHTTAPADKVVVVSGTRKSKRRCPWYYWIISILVLAFLLALVLAISFSGGFFF